LERYREALPMVIRSASMFDVGCAVGALAAVAKICGRSELSARLWGAYERLDDEAERRQEPELRALYEGAVGRLDELEVEAGRAISDDEVVALLQPTAADLAASLRSSA
jgi:hypothetical protein